MNQTQHAPTQSFWELVFDGHAMGVRDIKQYIPETLEYIDLLNTGHAIDPYALNEMCFVLANNDEMIPDLVFNYMAWPIMSSRLLEVLRPKIEESVQLLPAPLYECDGITRIGGWHVVNVLTVIDCVDMDASAVRYVDGRAVGYVVGKTWIDGARTQGAHMFRYCAPNGDVGDAVICSYELVNSLVGRGFTGLAFAPCLSP